MSADTPDDLDERDPRIASLISYAHEQHRRLKSPPIALRMVVVMGALIFAVFFAWAEEQSFSQREYVSPWGHYNVPEESSLDAVEGKVIDSTKIAYFAGGRRSWGNKFIYYANIETDDGAVVRFQCPVFEAYFDETECFFRNTDANPAGMMGQRVRLKLFYFPNRYYNLQPIILNDGGIQRSVQPTAVGTVMQATEFLDGREFNIISYEEEAARIRAYQAEHQPYVLMELYSWLDHFGIKHPPLPTTEISVTRP